MYHCVVDWIQFCGLSAKLNRTVISYIISAHCVPSCGGIISCLLGISSHRTSPTHSGSYVIHRSSDPSPQHPRPPFVVYVGDSRSVTPCVTSFVAHADTLQFAKGPHETPGAHPSDNEQVDSVNTPTGSRWQRCWNELLWFPTCSFYWLCKHLFDPVG